MGESISVRTAVLWLVLSAACSVHAQPVLNLGTAALGDLWLSGSWLAFTVRESDQADDLNGDGDLDDGVFEAVELASARRRPIVPAGSVLDFTPAWLAFTVSESVDATDLNGDGDAEDRVVHVHELATGSTLGLGLAADRVRLAEDRIGVEVSESGQGVDLNGDGDRDDVVIHVRDLRSAVTRNTRLAARLLDLHGDTLLVYVEEAAGGRDLNGDGDVGDVIYHVHELTTGTTSSLGIAGGGPLGRPEDGIVPVQVLEDQQGQDLNGDGDALDGVPHLLRLESADAVSLELAVRSISGPIGHRLAVSVSEPQQGADLNGDGDEGDNVVHVIDLDLLESAPRFLRGDCNGDGSVAASIADAVAHLRWAFGGGARPPCLAACDSNGDGTVGGAITDVLYLLGWGFLGGPTPPAPFPRCGASLRPGDAALGCEAADVCP